MTNENLIIELLQEIKQEQQKMNQRLDKIEQRFDRVDQNINFLAAEIGKLKMVNHSQAMHEQAKPAKQQLVLNGQMSDETLKNSVQGTGSLEHLEELWKNVLVRVGQEISKPSFETWIKSTKLLSYNSSDATVTISAPNSFARDWLENHYMHLIKCILTELTGEELLINFVDQKTRTDFDLPKTN